MKVKFAFLVVVIVSFCSFGHAQEKSWKVRYNAGPLLAEAESKNWENKLSVGTDEIVLLLQGGQKIAIPANSVTGLSYGQEAYHRLTTMFAVFGLFHKSREHFIGIEYADDGKKRGILLQGDKDDYREILTALKQATGASIATSDKEDRRYIAELEEPKPVEQAEAASDGTLHVTVEPNGSDVYVDHDFAGKTPCVVPIEAGRHKVTVVARGFIDWTREFKVSRGEQVTIKAALQRAPQ